MIGEIPGIGALVASASLLTLAVVHSWLGERRLLGPLLTSPNLPSFVVGSTFAKNTLRLAWHLTSLTWLALAYLMVRGQVAPVPVAMLLATSGVATYAATRGRHVAWAVFMLGAVGAASASGGQASSAWHTSIAVIGAATLAAIGGMHLAWASGLRWGLVAAVPSARGRSLFTPPAATTLLVAAGLFGAAWLTLALGGLIPSPVPDAWLGPAGIFVALVFAARTVGDLRYVGLFKRVRGSRFARQDDALFTPLCFALCAAIVLQL